MYFGRPVRFSGVSWPGCLLICATRRWASSVPTWKAMIELTLPNMALAVSSASWEVLVGEDQREAVLAVTGEWNTGTPGSVFIAAA